MRKSLVTVTVVAITFLGNVCPVQANPVQWVQDRAQELQEQIEKAKAKTAEGIRAQQEQDRAASQQAIENMGGHRPILAHPDTAGALQASETNN